eukprot:TRINITY_DN13896_c0_g1_i1.p1 TRINITY_DN13896_c0_g1~~TRINITY_DN13896_c0_g1_i1.p1  ORF type:complete len:251 (-),score=37.71 TRINITY_DN13896_c0_g1_i1:111-863(-)
MMRVVACIFLATLVASQRTRPPRRLRELQADDWGVNIEDLKNKCNWKLLAAGEYCTLFQLSDGSLVKADAYKVGFITSAVQIRRQALCPNVPGLRWLTKLGLMHINSVAGTQQTNLLTEVDWDLFGVEGSLKLTCTAVGYEAKIFLSQGKVSIIELQLALGVSSEVGYLPEDRAVEVKFIGTGVELGGKTGVCVFDTCFYVNFNRLFGNGRGLGGFKYCPGGCQQPERVARVEPIKRCRAGVCEWEWDCC